MIDQSYDAVDSCECSTGEMKIIVLSTQDPTNGILQLEQVQRLFSHLSIKFRKTGRLIRRFLFSVFGVAELDFVGLVGGLTAEGSEKDAVTQREYGAEFEDSELKPMDDSSE
ncbi:hypothetical protein X801_02623 [Opisthorchis viverrini]|uniref:Uncharacterized protein n=1 Tax=Opisthorchis viverrini TaxID=6198 RepID=A0A1S8X4U5_OPIVI|nr:hypothetical protein X801_02623 [Opisthorchis viverrini]